MRLMTSWALILAKQTPVKQKINPPTMPIITFLFIGLSLSHPELFPDFLS
jgi:hypothetical protein